jgi:hypothetical protein
LAAKPVLTRKEVEIIRRRLRAGEKQASLAREYQVAPVIVRKIAQQESYTHIFGAKRSAAQNGRLARQKGKVYQKYICTVLARRFGLPPEELYSAMAGVTGSDATLSREARKHWPFSTEVKNCRVLNIRAWIEQAERDAKRDARPFALIFKPFKGRTDYVCLELDEFLALMP